MKKPVKPVSLLYRLCRFKISQIQLLQSGEPPDIIQLKLAKLLEQEKETAKQSLSLATTEKDEKNAEAAGYTLYKHLESRLMDLQNHQIKETKAELGRIQLAKKLAGQSKEN